MGDKKPSEETFQGVQCRKEGWGLPPGLSNLEENGDPDKYKLGAWKVKTLERGKHAGDHGQGHFQRELYYKREYRTVKCPEADA